MHRKVIINDISPLFTGHRQQMFNLAKRLHDANVNSIGLNPSNVLKKQQLPFHINVKQDGECEVVLKTDSSINDISLIQQFKEYLKHNNVKFRGQIDITNQTNHIDIVNMVRKYKNVINAESLVFVDRTESQTQELDILRLLYAGCDSYDIKDIGLQLSHNSKFEENLAWSLESGVRWFQSSLLNGESEILNYKISNLGYYTGIDDEKLLDIDVKKYGCN
jgi:hypothetical protein